MNKKKLGGFFGALAAIAAAIVASRGGATKPAPPVVPPAASTYTLTVHVFRGDPVLDHKVVGAAVVSGNLHAVADGAGNVDLSGLPAGAREVCASAEGFSKACEAVTIPTGSVDLSLSPVVAPIVALQRLVSCGKFFCLNSGDAWTAIETSEFSLYKRFLDGEDIRPILAERQAIGFDLLRVWLLNTSVVPGGIQPKQYADFYAKLAPFASLCAEYGFYVEFTAFTQTPALMPNVDEQRRHWEQTQDALRPLTNVLLELVNEYDHGSPRDNTPDRSLWSMRPAGIVSSSGSASADAPPPEPVWDYVLYHSNGLSEFQRKVGHNAMEWADKYRLPAMANENTRYPDDDASEAHAFDAAAGAAQLSAGSCFHSEQGKQSRLFSEKVKNSQGHEIAPVTAFAAAWVAGAKSVPLEFRTGTYIHRADLEGPTCIRAYEKRLPDGRSVIVRIRP